MDSWFISALFDKSTPHDQRHVLIKTASGAQIQLIRHLIKDLYENRIEVDQRELPHLRKIKRFLIKASSNKVTRTYLAKNYKKLLFVLHIISPWMADTTNTH